MEKEASYKEKVAELDEWMPSIIETVKKDLKQEHLKQDFVFVKQYFQNKNLSKIELPELANAYRLAIRNHDNGETIAEFIANRWILKKSEMYHYFETELSQIAPNFTEIKELPKDKADALLKSAVEEFGAVNTYVFSVLNSVAFGGEHLGELKVKAKAEEKSQREEKTSLEEHRTIDSLKKNHERELARIIDKYEKKLLGLQRKYVQDVERLKAQVAALHKKLQA